MEIKLTSNVNVKTKGVKRILKLHFYMHVLHVVKIRSYIEESFTEWKEIKEEKKGEYSSDYCSKKSYLWYQEHPERSSRAKSGIKT